MPPCWRPRSSKGDRALHPARDGRGVVRAAQARDLAAGGAGGGGGAQRAGGRARGGRRDDPRPARPSRVEAVKERERVTDHDVAAFVDVVAASVGEPGRWVHHGLTSSDVLDTALALQLSQAGADAGGRRLRLPRRPGAPGARAGRHAVRRAHPRRAGRAHDVRAEAGRLRLRGPPQRAPPGARRGGSLGGRALRRGRHLRRQRPRDRGRRAAPARSEPRGRLHAGGAARPPRRAAGGHRARGRRAGALRDRDPPPAAHRGARGGGALPGGSAEGLLGHAPQAQPDRQRAHHGHRPASARLRPGRAGERGPVARARHLALGGGTGDPAGRDHPPRLRPAPGHPGGARA